MRHILLVEDDSITGDIVRDYLEAAGFTVHLAMTMQAAREKNKEQAMDLILLDITLPDGDGFDLALEFHNKQVCPPIVYMTSRTDIEDIRKGFETGAHDYIKKPFVIEELVLRIRYILGDFSTSQGKNRQIGKYIFNPTTQTLQYKNEYVILGRLQAAVLSELSEKIGAVVPKTVLLEKYWEGTTYFTSRNLDSVVVKLRERFKEDPSIHFLALKKEGYRLVIF